MRRDAFEKLRRAACCLERASSAAYEATGRWARECPHSKSAADAEIEAAKALISEVESGK